MGKYIYAEAGVGYFINGEKECLENVFKESMQRTGEGENKDIRIGELMLDYEYSWWENMETIDDDIKEIINDDPNFNEEANWRLKDVSIEDQIKEMELEWQQ